MHDLLTACRDALRAIAEEKDGAGVMDMPTPLEQALQAILDAEEPPANYHLLEAVADIAITIGHGRYYSGDSRADVAACISWAEEFHAAHRNTDWDEAEPDYITAVDRFATAKLEASQMQRDGMAAPLESFEVYPVGEKDGNCYRCLPDDPHRFGFGLYAMNAAGLPTHIADFSKELDAYAARDALNKCQTNKEQTPTP